MEIFENPPINIFHMNHEPTYYSNPKINEMKNIYNIFQKMNQIDKLEYIKTKKETIIDFYYA
jgi:hypothetical protein